MKRQVFRRLLTMGLAVPVLNAGLASCVNEDYDMKDKKWDLNVTTMRNFAMPVGNVQQIQLGWLLDLSNQDLILTDNAGDYFFQFKNEPVETHVSMPQLSFNGAFTGNAKSDKHTITLEFPKELAGQDVEIAKQYCQAQGIDLTYHLLNNSVEKMIKVDRQLDYRILGVKSLELDGKVAYHFEITDGTIHVAEGFQMDFPDYMHISMPEGCTEDYYTVIDNNIVRFTKDTKLEKDKPLALALSITKMNLPERAVVTKENFPEDQWPDDWKDTNIWPEGPFSSNGLTCNRVYINPSETQGVDVEDKIIVSGDVYANLEEQGGTIPEKIVMYFYLGFEDMEVKKAAFRLDLTQSINDTEISLEALPDMFKSGSLVLDLWNPTVRIQVDNNSPVGVEVNADVDSRKEGAESVHFHVGYNGTSDSKPVEIGAYEEKVIYISRRPGAAEEEAEEIVIPEIGDMIKSFPDVISIHDVRLHTKNQDADGPVYVVIEPYDQYTSSVEYTIMAKVAFGEDMQMSFSEDIAFNMDFGMLGLSSFGIAFEAENSIPLDFALKAEALDAEGNPVPEISFGEVCHIAAGSHLSPTVSAINLMLRNSGETIDFKNLRLTFTATCPDARFQGVALNKEQGLAINNISLCLPDGISVDVEKMLIKEEADTDVE